MLPDLIVPTFEDKYTFNELKKLKIMMSHCEEWCYLVCLPDFEDWHAGDDGVRVVFGGRVDGVVGADDKNLKMRKRKLKVRFLCSNILLNY